MHQGSQEWMLYVKIFKRYKKKDGEQISSAKRQKDCPICAYFSRKRLSDIDMIEVDYARLSKPVGNDYVLAVRLLR